MYHRWLSRRSDFKASAWCWPGYPEPVPWTSGGTDGRRRTLSIRGRIQRWHLGHEVYRKSVRDYHQKKTTAIELQCRIQRLCFVSVVKRFLVWKQMCFLPLTPPRVCAIAPWTYIIRQFQFSCVFLTESLLEVRVENNIWGNLWVAWRHPAFLFSEVLAPKQLNHRRKPAFDRWLEGKCIFWAGNI